MIKSAREIVIRGEIHVCQISIHGSKNHLIILRVFRTDVRLKSFTNRRAGITALDHQTHTANHAHRIQIVTQDAHPKLTIHAHPRSTIHAHQSQIATHAHQLFTATFLTLHGVPRLVESHQALKRKIKRMIKTKIKGRIKRNAYS